MKKGVLIPGIFLVSILAISLVSAQALPAPANLPASIGLPQIAEYLRDLLIGGTGEDLVARFLLVMLLTTVLFLPAQNITGKKSALSFIIALIVSVLGIRFFPQIQLLLLPYGVLAIAISSILPLVLFGAFLMTGIGKESPTIRKIGWCAFGGTFFFLWLDRYKTLGDLSYIYFGIAVISVAFLLFDGTIQNALIMSRMRNANSRGAWRQQSDLEEDIRKDRLALANLIISNTNEQNNGRIKNAKDIIANKEKALSDLYKTFKP